MSRTLHLLFISTRREIMQWLGWRAFLLTLIINQMVSPLIGLAIWSVALPGNHQISSYYVALLAVQLMTVSYENHTFANGIYDGTFSQQLLKPQPVILGPLGTNIALRSLHLLFGLPLLIGVGIATGTNWDPRMILLALPALILAAILRFLFTYLLALSAFWSEQAHAIVSFGETLIFLLGGSAAPIALFPANLRNLGEISPMYALLGFPAEIMSSGLNQSQILSGYGWLILWILVFMLALQLTWRAGLRRYTAIGG
ncbi:ABC transporter permease [Dictyobacter alpinus]|uniref:ABC transporter permease n=1 Tax=Dictyobacter alpinus TaxID=2014873 RepID=A0A402BAV8_9CHLR|nr:ABC-2 family transporter protein [Dictyobacter alpinus]GCE28474.1 ABC transporter permease [Dictyobacter alpinus]